jgi:hypothetical protein
MEENSLRCREYSRGKHLSPFGGNERGALGCLSYERRGQGRRGCTSWREQWVSRGFEYGKVGARGDAAKGMAGSQVQIRRSGFRGERRWPDSASVAVPSVPSMPSVLSLLSGVFVGLVRNHALDALGGETIVVIDRPPPTVDTSS